ncbi:hypothetical protein AVEN_158553-1, partial [Araneus ventricosus]
MPANARTSKTNKSTGEDFSAVHMDCCRLCMRRRNGMAGWIPNGNKSPSMTPSDQAADCENKALASGPE